MKFTYNLTQSEFFYVYLRNHFLTNKSAYIFFIVMDFILINEADKITIPIMIVLCSPLLHLLSALWDTYSFVKKRLVPAAGGIYIIEVKDDIIEFSYNLVNLSVFKLDFIFSIKKKKMVYFLTFKNLNQIILPLSMFETEEEEQKFIELINKNMGVPRKETRSDILDS